MHKTIKLVFEKLEVGTIVWDCRQREWRTITGIENRCDSILEFYIGEEFYSYNLIRWELKYKPKYMRLTAMKVPLEVEDVPAVEYEISREVFFVFCTPHRTWSINDTHLGNRVVGAKYYTEENAELVCEIMKRRKK